MTNQALNVINLPVYTVSGQQLGRVVGVEVEDAGKRVRCYQVSSVLPLVKLWGEKLLISPEQVVNISIKAMTVKDAVISQTTKAKNQPKLVPEPSA